ncbi:beta-xylosidase/alpha-L-arabinofuranosidase 1-like [Herrania umbratica]|uniref:Beta-xylosidase/alpha-L-arabinofuranosidase 1-like n=1 Tax=Herrania umbratica TaxID=108875 RepID=A0A6J1B9F2_9ROSI|nr:beta-xylosidase/alpha-L-arabinofuranosidase 1-like [Herrania umbratica]
MAAQSFKVLRILFFLIIYFLPIFVAGGDIKPIADPPSYVCDPHKWEVRGKNMSDFGYCDKSLPYEVRAKDLVDRLTLAEKVQQMGNNASSIPRLGLPAYNWWSEALHGVSNVGPGTFFTEIVPGATSFPTVIHTTAAFNQSLWNAIGKVVSTEARAMYNLGQGGLTYWSPNINPVRDPRWGRITETSGEDPFVVGVYGANYVRGLQDVEGQEHTADPGSRPLKVSACCKHYAAYDVDNWYEFDRLKFDAQVTEQDMIETFLRPFEMCVKDGDVSSVMCSYNQVNKVPTCADPILLKQTLREEWKLNGYIVSDCDSVEVIHKEQRLDLDCGVTYPNALENSVKQGKANEAEIDTSLQYLYVVLMRLGFFDGSPSFTSLGKDDVCTQDHIELAAEAAREGIVLLNNVDATLPLNPDAFKTLAIIGPLANATKQMLGNYEGLPCQYVSPLSGFSAFGQVIYEQGCPNVKCPNDTLILQATEAAKQADATILVVGTDRTIEEESRDRYDLLLPGLQKDLINQVANASKGPVILVVMSAGGVDISFAKDNNRIKGILWVGHPGQEGGRAIADVVFGKYNPGGRLPLTWYTADYVSKLPMTSMPLRPVEEKGYPGRTYKFFNGSVVYPFAYGLSYTTFNYKVTTPTNVSIPIKLNKNQQCRELELTDTSAQQPCPSVVANDLTCEDKIAFEVEVQNTGDKDGSEVVIVYSKPPEGIVETPFKQVVGFERVFVAAKQSQKVKFELNACKSLNIVDSSGYRILPSGLHKIVLGTSSDQIEVDVSFAR